MSKRLSPTKAKEILRHGEVHGKPLTKKQRGFMGVVAGGNAPTRTHVTGTTLERRTRAHARARGERD